MPTRRARARGKRSPRLRRRPPPQHRGAPRSSAPAHGHRSPRRDPPGAPPSARREAARGPSRDLRTGAVRRTGAAGHQREGHRRTAKRAARQSSQLPSPRPLLQLMRQPRPSLPRASRPRPSLRQLESERACASQTCPRSEAGGTRTARAWRSHKRSTPGCSTRCSRLRARRHSSGRGCCRLPCTVRLRRLTSRCTGARFGARVTRSSCCARSLRRPLPSKLPASCLERSASRSDRSTRSGTACHRRQRSKSWRSAARS